MIACILVVLVMSCVGGSPTSPLAADSPRDPAAVSHHRVRRQNGEVVESIFQIPIQTLMAVSKVFTTGIQSFQRQREAFYQATGGTGVNRPGTTAALAGTYGSYAQYNRPRPGSSSSAASAIASAYSSYSRPRASTQQSHAASVAGVGAQADGSSYRI